MISQSLSLQIYTVDHRIVSTKDKTCLKLKETGVFFSCGILLVIFWEASQSFLMKSGTLFAISTNWPLSDTVKEWNLGYLPVKNTLLNIFDCPCLESLGDGTGWSWHRFNLTQLIKKNKTKLFYSPIWEINHWLLCCYVCLYKHFYLW